MKGRHGLVSFAHPEQIEATANVCSSFVLDNGAYTFWKGSKKPDWKAYYKWCEKWLFHPACDWAIIPDVIDGSEQDNHNLLQEWPFGIYGVPVWHLHEKLSRLESLVNYYPRIAIGSSGEYAKIGTDEWWQRMKQAFRHICDESGKPPCKIHGLRMLNPAIFELFPFSSCDSCMVALNINLDVHWKGPFAPKNKVSRGVLMAERIEHYLSAHAFDLKMEEQLTMF
jgi:hypothetical protein